MNTPLIENERIVKEGFANIMRGIEAVGGKLYLTNFRLIFEPHPINFQTDLEIIDIRTIKTINMIWTKVFGILPLVPNSFELELQEVQKVRFVVNGRRKWIKQIEKVLDELVRV
jgi:hypothetical protein